MASFLEKILRTGDKRLLKKLRVYAEAINSLEEDFKAYTDAELRAETDAFKARLEDGEQLDRLLPEAFAAVREASARTLGQRHYDVQLMGGAALHLGNIAEMKTGEGKTLVATLPAYLNALTGKGVHVVTVNDYLAEYQANLMGRVYRFLGMEPGVILSQQTPEQRRKQYAADITYGTNNEFGFDYLRDNMAWSVDERVQRGHHFAIVDEVDSILIDEARTPLIISGPAAGEANRWYGEFARVARDLVRDRDYEVDEKKKTVGVLEPGIEKVEDHLGIDNLYESENTPLIGFLNNAIKAKELFANNKDYVVLKGEVLIVDEHTGRILPGRRYNEGVHQSIEAKEKVEVKAENQTMATVTLQNYFRLYDKLSGMTGTAETEAAEFVNTYDLGIAVIDPNKPLQRIDQPDLVYKNEVAKFAAVVKDIAKRHEKGQPVLVGTTSVEKSEYLSKLLAKQGVRHEVLNAKNHAREAAIVAQAGRKGAVTVATNMAGRGTDIMLGGNAEFDAVEKMAELGLDPAEKPEEYEAKWPEVLAACEEATKKEHEEVKELGGLYVLGTERHESRRIDNQLRGRSGRQGDPGESRFYLSLSDDLMRLFNGAAAARLMAGAPDDTALEHRIVSRVIASAQNQVEARNAEQRKNILKYDDVLNRQREAMYADRARILEDDDIAENIQKFVTEVLTSAIEDKTSHGHAEDWDLEQLWELLAGIYPISITVADLEEAAGGRGKITQQMIIDEVLSDARVIYEQREEQVGSEAMRTIERRVVLSVIGRHWPEHLYEMDYLKEGIGLRAMAQRDPLVEYQREGYAMFQEMMGAIREETVAYLFKLDLSKQRTRMSSQALEVPQQPKFLRFTAPGESGEQLSRVEATGESSAEEQAGKAAGADRAASEGAGAGADASGSAGSADGEASEGQPTGNRAARRARRGSARSTRRR
ncbi:preprotein translocase subunit SecA [Rothia kristinae]|uniref:preprotein translocase subunit SecA n=1 Tax=Rothia kristinae TaxID=37923 RepID=UPI000C26BE64|nr:preprotein translocase subunit SecA [Rothia kristinae]TDP56761.1 preprotein translocase subunit SecA [Kocuria sp. AG109]MCT1357443.1 preprotein translocase subunit SecA [Rothia kristinae]MCT1393131.1 preprotein translocase subunit SecA [Rothia kristinae]MCT1506351.1 preprotein translocase subunit SecA [Rothia kristinae]MCT2038804.1 preprotein translocase subunit SecA [Rothia kristinae]